MTPTAEDWQVLLERLSMAFPSRENYPREKAYYDRLAAGIKAQIEQAKADSLVFRPAADAWQIGFAHAPATVTYPNGPEALLLAHAAFSRPWKTVDPIDVLPHLKGEARIVGNNLRNFRGRLADWIDSTVGCMPLADAVRSVTISNECYVRYDPAVSAPRILT